jgi:hypothetical protein
VPLVCLVKIWRLPAAFRVVADPILR